MMKQEFELLAPAGSFEILKAVIEEPMQTILQKKNY